jgi:hypothetical protein
MQSRGIAFAADALFAIAVIAAFAISVVPASPAQAAVGDAAPDAVLRASFTAMRSMCLATVGELSGLSEVAALYSDGNLTANDSEMTACQLVARLSKDSGTMARAKSVLAQAYGPLVPPALGLGVYSDGALAYNTSIEPGAPAAMHSSAAYVYSYGKAGAGSEPIGPVKIEARAWVR